jgi:hypothetical protein
MQCEDLKDGRVLRRGREARVEERNRSSC